MKEFQPYPKWKYHAEKPARVVHSEEDEMALEQGWVDSPAHIKKPEPKAVEPVLETAPADQPKRSYRRSKA